MCDRIVSVFTIVDERLCVASSYLVGEGGGEASSEVICWVNGENVYRASLSLSHTKPIFPACKRTLRIARHVTTLRLRKGNMQNLLLTCTSGTGFTFLTLLLSAMLYGRGRKVLTLWGGRECSSSDSGVRANKPGDTSLSSWPVLVLLALDKKRELKGRSQTERKENTGEKKKKKAKETRWESWDLGFQQKHCCVREQGECVGKGRRKDWEAALRIGLWAPDFLCFWCESWFDSLRIQMEKKRVSHEFQLSKVSCKSATNRSSTGYTLISHNMRTTDG